MLTRISMTCSIHTAQQHYDSTAVIEPQIGLERLPGLELERMARAFQANLLDEQTRACPVATEPAQHCVGLLMLRFSDAGVTQGIIAKTKRVTSISHHFILKAEASR